MHVPCSEHTCMCLAHSMHACVCARALLRAHMHVPCSPHACMRSCACLAQCTHACALLRAHMHVPCSQHACMRSCARRAQCIHAWPCADTPSEDILSVLYDALEFIDNALKSGGRVLVHCSQVWACASGAGRTLGVGGCGMQGARDDRVLSWCAPERRHSTGAQVWAWASDGGRRTIFADGGRMFNK
eukprot:366157-Chlamydomonas_euryale.AAC.15